MISQRRASGRALILSSPPWSCFAAGSRSCASASAGDGTLLSLLRPRRAVAFLRLELGLTARSFMAGGAAGDPPGRVDEIFYN
jgi:hypothetical protein